MTVAGRLVCDGCGVESWNGDYHAAACPATVTVGRGVPDRRVAASRVVAGGPRLYPVGGHRDVRPEPVRGSVGSRPGRVVWTPVVYRRRLRLGIDT